MCELFVIVGGERESGGGGGSNCVNWCQCARLCKLVSTLECSILSRDPSVYDPSVSLHRNPVNIVASEREVFFCGFSVWLVISESRKKEWAVARKHHRHAARWS